MRYETRVEKIDEDLIKGEKLAELKEHQAIRLGARLLRQGEVVAFPTETVYGLGADATSNKAVGKIFKAKGRPQDNPLIVHIATKDQLEQVIEGGLTPAGRRLIEAFWPGPLTIILNKSELISVTTTAGLTSVAIRMPSHPVARALIAASSLPIAAPSANLSGAPSPTLAEHVLNDLKGKIPLIIDGGPARVGVESTVVDVRKDIPVILRPGGVSREEIEETLGFEVRVAGGQEVAEGVPPSPGMKYRHYSPRTPLILLEEKERDKIAEMTEEYSNKRIGLVITAETLQELNNLPENVLVVRMGSRSRPEEIASNLFALLRRLDQRNLDLILIEAIPEKGIGAAVMNRLYKASTRE